MKKSSLIILPGHRIISEDRDSDIFNIILSEAVDLGFVDPTVVFGDSTHQKASVNKNKHTDEQIEVVKNI